MKLIELIISTYKKVFYSIYSVVNVKEKVAPTFTSILIFSFIQDLNLIEVIILLSMGSGIQLTTYINKRSSTALIITFILINSIILYSRKRHKKIIEELDRKNVNLKYSWLYILISILLIFILAPILHRMGQSKS